jgi:hypothetical protein
MSAHTPGGWDFACDSYGKVQHSRKACVYTTVIGPNGGEQLVRVASRIDNWNDARLIAAAPDLLEALRGVLRVADRATAEFDAARAAIAKATGGAA